MVQAHGVFGILLRNGSAPQQRPLFQYFNCQKISPLLDFKDFDLEACFAQQWRALFEHRLNFQKMCFVHFDFNMYLLRATMPRVFSTSTCQNAPKLRCLAFWHPNALRTRAKLTEVFLPLCMILNPCMHVKPAPHISTIQKHQKGMFEIVRQFL